eukprot:CAMPEP_0119328548 /NCGR_PEP_ID=MMETSP1333-20130426/73583_1 /TAXON_ID=418940 /ORGANISM="Scyphosphaera apsteinii, Strain RCC1455" /LENGTH=499 /DNA_ID=CAMNT_0007337429 /DNA_START=48 /DNA_END=1547 /DNA_ORIENTATION=+
MTTGVKRDASGATRETRVNGSALQQFDFVDENGTVESLALNSNAISCIPYLHTMVTTDVGLSRAGARVVSLPPGCSSAACRMLVLKASSQCESLHVLLLSSSLEDTLVLMQSADFLCLTPAVPELDLLCRLQARSDEDKLRLLVNTHPVAQPVVGKLDGTALINVMATDQVVAMVEQMKPGLINPAQLRVLLRWLRVSLRSLEDVKKVFPVHTLSRIVWVQSQSNQKLVELFPESIELLSEVAKIAASWPEFLSRFLAACGYATCAPGTGKHFRALPREDRDDADYSTDANVGLPRFVNICIGPLCTIASCLSLDVLTTQILPFLLRPHVFSAQRCGDLVLEHLSRLLDHRSCTYQEAEKLIPVLLSTDFATNPALGSGMVERVQVMLDHYSTMFTKQQLLNMLDVVNRSFDKARVADQVAAVYVKLIVSAEPAAQEEAIGHLVKAGGWQSHVTLPFISKLCSEAQVKLVALLMPLLTNASIDAGVREYITNAVLNDDL